MRLQVRIPPGRMDVCGVKTHCIHIIVTVRHPWPQKWLYKIKFTKVNFEPLPVELQITFNRTFTMGVITFGVERPYQNEQRGLSEHEVIN